MIWRLFANKELFNLNNIVIPEKAEFRALSHRTGPTLLREGLFILVLPTF